MALQRFDDPRCRRHAEKLPNPRRRNQGDDASEAARLASIDALIDSVARARLHRAVEDVVRCPTPENLALLSEWPSAWVAEEQAQHPVDWILLRDSLDAIPDETTEDDLATNDPSIPPDVKTPLGIIGHCLAWARRIPAIIRRTEAAFEQPCLR
jgi:hypothetical protein